jgi:hypothetical protein
MVHQHIIILLKFFSACPYRHPFWRGSLRHTDPVSTITTIILHPIRCATTIIIIWHPIGCIISGGCSGGGWRRGIPSKRRCSFGVDAVILTHLLFFLGVVDDDDVVVTGGPRMPRFGPPKSLRTISSSDEVSRAASSSLMTNLLSGTP